MPSKLHSNTRPHLGSFTLKKLSAAVVSALLLSNAHAAGLGKLTVLSALGQPLQAEIELTSVSKDEIGSLTAKLASVDAFKQANVDFNPALIGLRFVLEQRGERQFIRVTSSQPLNEPFVDMLMELGGPNGRLVREYTFLLDPPDLRATQTAQVAPASVSDQLVAQGRRPTAQSTPSAQTSQAVAEPSTKRPVQSVSPATQRPPAEPAALPAQQNDYHVKSGDTLAKIAGQVRTNGVSLDQMLVALYQANPNAFSKNMNRLKAGQILSVPSADTARSISDSEAHAIVVAQSTDFNNYRAKLASRVAVLEPEKSAETKQSAGGKITAKVEEKSAPAVESRDKLKLSNAMAAPGAEKSALAAPAGETEDKIARDKAVAEANARVKELEKNVADLQKILEVKNKSLAEQQKQVQAKPEPNPAASTASAQTAPVPAAAPTASAPAESTAKPVAPAKPRPKPVTPPPQPEPGFVDELMSSPMLLPGLGALLVALGGLGIYSARRKKQSKQFEDSIITDSSLKANSLFGSTGGQSVDTNNSVFNSSFSPSASQLDTNEVDPVAEADVYIAYGRDAQAEEILKEALRTQPGRHTVRLKLLEIYSNRKDLRAFEVLATELYGLTKGEGEDWAAAASMGAAIDPDNPLYALDRDGPPTIPGTMVAPTQPISEQGLATLLSEHADTDAPTTEADLEAETSYFSNTVPQIDVPAELANVELGNSKETKAQPLQSSSNDLDFDLEGIGIDEAPVNSQQSASTTPETVSDLSSIDFDFLDDAKPSEPAPATDTQANSVPELTIDLVPQAQDEAPAETASKVPVIPEIPAVSDIADLEFMPVGEIRPNAMPAHAPANEMSSLDIEIPGLDDAIATGNAESGDNAPVDSMDFNLADISLDLNPGGKSIDSSSEGLDLSGLSGLDTDVSSADAEMSTKLDLAIAYREIGDKEGARELLDEVLKGGSPEQSEKAKSLLLELA